MSPAQQRQIGLVGCIAATTTVTVALGVVWPLLAIVLEHQGVPAWLNGLSASAQMMAVLFIAPLAPRIIGMIGTTRSMAFGIVGMIVSMAMLPLFPNVWAWFPIRFALGFSAELVFTCGDIWINQMATDKTRGRLIGIYGVFLTGGFALGPATIAVLGSDNWHALFIGIGVIALGLIPLYMARGLAPIIEGNPRARMLNFLRLAPTLLIAGLMYGLIDSSTLSLLPVYGIEKGLDADASALLLTMFVIGALVGQLPVGWLSDRMDRRHLMVICILITMFTLVLVPFAIGNNALTWAVMLAMGVGLGSFYIIGMAMMGDRFQGADLVGINATFMFAWGVGMVIGPFIGGSAIEAFGPDGMPAVSAGLCGLFCLFVVWRIRTAARRKGTVGSGLSL